MTHIYKAKDENKRYTLQLVSGDGLEGIGLRIPYKGYARIDHNAEVKIGDLVHCTDHYGSLTTFIKQVKEINGDSIIVGTSYLDSSKDFEFEAGAILGVVEEVYCKLTGFRKYIRRAENMNESKETSRGMRKYLKKLRKEKGLTQLDVSKTIGVGASTYTMIENGDRHKILDLLWVERLAKCFEVSIDYIVTEERKLSGR